MKVEATNKKKYNIVDGIVALILVFVLFFGYLLILKNYYLDYYNTEKDLLISQMIFSLIYFFLIIIYLIVRKQSLSSIGITKKNLKKSISLGLFCSFLFTLAFFIFHFIQDDINIKSDIKVILIRIIYFIVFVALFEEIVFRGFINSRMQGLFRNKYLTIFIVSILFSIMHLPFNSMWFSGSFEDYLIRYLPYHFILIFLHFFFTYLYNRYQNLAASSIFHFFYNFLQWLCIN